ncbi:MarR family winged helix-turn-helix transcriptional regulator [Actinoallomurus acaciae]|uniref:MarR family winged helix-turn-helix transcriptional regulator n=1 Tax=Actinoallomurus acaciae TaxID=502577 RepID=A0ABV5Y6R9_9ACTN
MTDPATSGDDRATTRPSLLYLVKQLELAVRSRLDEVLRPASITPLQYTALTVLERRSDLSTAELARNAFVTDQSAADMVGALEGRGLVLRHPDPRDRRRRVLRLTGEGRELLDHVRADVDAVEKRMLAPLAADEVDDLRRYIAACRSALASSPPH